MEAAAAAHADVPTSNQRRRRLPLAQLLFAAAGIALLIVCGAYALKYVSATAFHKERAFRVLDEIGSQLDNLQRTLTKQLRLMPEQLVGARLEAYQRRLAIQGPKAGVASVGKALLTQACPEPSRIAWSLRPREPGVPFTVFACTPEPQAGADGRLFTTAFQGSLAETLESFVSQSFFDEVLLTLSDGTVVASMPRKVATNVADAPLHPGKVARLGIVNAASLMGHATVVDDKKFVEPPSQPETTTARIADDNYRVFVRVVQPRYGAYIEQENGSASGRQDRLYLVGLKRLDLRAELSSSLEPGGRFLLTILILLAFLVWPLANVRAKSPEDSIAWPEAIACFAAAVLIPAVLAIAAVWVWSYQSLLAWVDAGAVRYANSVATTLHGELGEGRRVLEQYLDVYLKPKSADGVTQSPIPIRSRGDGTFVTGQVRECSKQQDRTCIVAVSSKDGGEWRGWTTFSSVFATNARGERAGEQRYTVYDAPLVKSDASYDDREYFRALQRGEGWATTASASGDASGFVAQRLFSGSDGSRVLQMAIPRPKA
ncbi:MAG: hypothetical protein ABW171_14395, partial [Steroidobacter sp.]